jgi:hypothetical protein
MQDLRKQGGRGNLAQSWILSAFIDMLSMTIVPTGNGAFEGVIQ